MRWFYGSFMACRPAARHVATHRKCRRHGGLAVEAADGGVGAKYSGYREGSIILQRGEQPPNEGTMSSIASVSTAERWSMTSLAACPRQPARSAIGQRIYGHTEGGPAGPDQMATEYGAPVVYVRDDT